MNKRTFEMNRTERIPVFQPSGLFILGITVLAVFTGGAVLFWGPLMSLVIIGGMILSIGVLFSLEFGLSLLFLLVILFQREDLFELSIPFFGGGLKPTDLLLIGILSGWAIRSVIKRRKAGEFPQPISGLVLAFVLWCGFAALLGITKGIYYKDSLVELRPILQYLLFFPIVSELNNEKIKRLGWIILFAAAISSVFGIIWYSRGIGGVATYTEGGLRVSNIHFSYLITGIIFAICCYLKSYRNLPVFLVFILTNLAALTVTFQRSAWLGLIGGLLFIYGLTNWEQKKVIARLLSLLLIIGFILYGAFSYYPERTSNPISDLWKRMASITDYREDVAAQHRLEEWKRAWEMFVKHPILGNGLGSRLVFHTPMYSEEREKMGYRSEDFYIHNSFVWVLTKTGLVGFFGFLMILGITLMRGYQYSRRTSRNSEASIVLWMGASLVALIIASFFGPMLTTDNVTPFVALILGGTSKWAKMNKREVELK